MLDLQKSDQNTTALRYRHQQARQPSLPWVCTPCAASTYLAILKVFQLSDIAGMSVRMPNGQVHGAWEGAGTARDTRHIERS